MKTLNTELNAAFNTALNKHEGKQLFAKPVAAERLGKFVAERNKPRPASRIQTWRWSHKITAGWAKKLEPGFPEPQNQRVPALLLRLGFAVLQQQQEPHVWEGKSRCNPSNCLNVPVTSVTPRESYLLLINFPNMVTISKHFSDDEFVCLCYCCVCFVCWWKPAI